MLRTKAEPSRERVWCVFVILAVVHTLRFAIHVSDCLQ